MFLSQPAVTPLFLVGIVRLLRSLGLGMNPKEMSEFLRKRLSGIEVDQLCWRSRGFR